MTYTRLEALRAVQYQTFDNLHTEALLSIARYVLTLNPDNIGVMQLSTILHAISTTHMIQKQISREMDIIRNAVHDALMVELSEDDRAAFKRHL